MALRPNAQRCLGTAVEAVLKYVDELTLDSDKPCC